ncbi:MAG: S8 family peptidase, partial [Bacteroidetes bacterium]|nr:S8 family peptidase [Bacteroidota bacterium]
PGQYERFNGTSAAAPHVAGVAALMQSKWDDFMAASNAMFVLAPEDIENIMQNSAIDVVLTLADVPHNDPFYLQYGVPGYDIYNGHGRINAEECLKQISLPYMLGHYRTYSPNLRNPQLVKSNAIIQLTENYGNLAAGVDYTADIYKITEHNPHYFMQADSIIDYWPRNSLSNVWAYNDSLVTPEDYVTMSSFSKNGVTLQGYTYHIKGPNINTWVPLSLSDTAKMFYSIHFISNHYSDIETLKASNQVTLFPNPSNGQFNLEFNLIQRENVKVQVFDFLGKLVHSPKPSEIEGQGIKLELNLSHLDPGVYMVKVAIRDEQTVFKVIKTD